MLSNWITLTGLLFNFVGALFMASSFVFRENKEVRNGKTVVPTITIGKKKGSSKTGIILLIIGFGIQGGSVILKMVLN